MWNRPSIASPVFAAVENVVFHDHDSGLLRLPTYADSRALYAASDYSGDQKESRYQVLACVITGSRQWQSWQSARSLVRRRNMPARRRMKYSALGDGSKLKALPAFLSAAGSIEGVLACLMIDKQIRSLFDSSGKIDINDTVLRPWRHWKSAQFERMFRIVNFVSLFVAGLSSPNQSVTWITDEDEIAGNRQQLEQLAAAFAAIMSCAPHGLNSLLCGTTVVDMGRLEIEDFAAIPDLAAGALADLFTAWKSVGVDFSTKLFLPIPEVVPKKAHGVLKWLFSSQHRIARILVLIEPGEGARDIRVRRIPVE